MTKQIKKFEELDEFIKKSLNHDYENCTEREFLASHQLDFVSFTRLFGSVPPEADPFSSDYADWEKKFFEFLSGRPYDFHNGTMLTNEAKTDMNIERTMPSQSELPSIISSHKTYADFLQFTSPQPGQRILEMGVKRGYLIEDLGKYGCEVFGIETSEYHSQSQLIKCQIHQGSFYDVSQLPGLFDMIVFQASFCHVGEPVRLLNQLHEKMAPSGRLIMFNEPIQSWFDRPWGVVRYDGETLFQIRYRGWLELGFRTDFFLEMIQRTGFQLTNNPILHDGSRLYEMMKIDDVKIITLDASNLGTQIGKKNGNSLSTQGKKGYLVFGPYLPLKAGRYRLTIKGRVYFLDKAYVDVASEKGSVQHALFTLAVPSALNHVIIFQDFFDLNKDVYDYEIRLFVGERDNLRFDSYTIEKLYNSKKNFIV